MSNEIAEGSPLYASKSKPELHFKRTLVRHKLSRSTDDGLSQRDPSPISVGHPLAPSPSLESSDSSASPVSPRLREIKSTTNDDPDIEAGKRFFSKRRPSVPSLFASLSVENKH